MGLEISEIEQEIDESFEEKFGFDINATSNAGDWKNWRGVTAQAIYSLQKLWDLFKTEILGLAATTEFGNKAWWSRQIKLFQYGDSLLEKDGVLYYLAIDEDKQIIKRVSINEKLLAGLLVVQIKVAKLSGLISVPISSDEKIALTSYVDDKKPAGIATQIISVNADEVKVTETIYYDGKLEASVFANALIQARKDYLAGIEFDGQFNINSYRAALKGISGVEDTDIQLVEIKPSGGIFVSVHRVYDPVSGHYILNEDDSNITFIAQ